MTRWLYLQLYRSDVHNRPPYKNRPASPNLLPGEGRRTRTSEVLFKQMRLRVSHWRTGRVQGRRRSSSLRKPRTKERLIRIIRKKRRWRRGGSTWPSGCTRGRPTRGIVSRETMRTVRSVGVSESRATAQRTCARFEIIPKVHISTEG